MEDLVVLKSFLTPTLAKRWIQRNKVEDAAIEKTAALKAMGLKTEQGNYHVVVKGSVYRDSRQGAKKLKEQAEKPDADPNKLSKESKKLSDMSTKMDRDYLPKHEETDTRADRNYKVWQQSKEKVGEAQTSAQPKIDKARDEGKLETPKHSWKSVIREALLEALEE